MATLQYDSRDGNYHAVMDDQHLIVDGDAYAEARQQRERYGMPYEQADAETADAAGWEEGMTGVTMRNRRGPKPGTGGRPPTPQAEQRVYVGVRLAPATLATIKAAQRPKESLGKVIDRLIQQTTA